MPISSYVRVGKINEITRITRLLVNAANRIIDSEITQILRPRFSILLYLSRTLSNQVSIFNLHAHIEMRDGERIISILFRSWKE
jgi:gamma-glutamyl:cysteine ligase YbdK (ATP-grasp superfamily)